MSKAWQWLKGKKTYLMLAVAGGSILAHKLLGVPYPPGVSIDEQAYTQQIWILLLAAAARHGISTGA